MDETVAAIEAINKLPKSIKLSDEALVVAARDAFNKIATKEQQALVTNLSVLESAERKIKNLKADQTPDIPPVDNDCQEPQKDSDVGYIVAIIVLSAVVFGGAAFITLYILKVNGKLARKPKATPASGEDLPSDSTEENQ